MSNEQRRSFRYPVQEEFTRATIQSKRKVWPATLVNESSGGMLLATDPDAPLNVGDKITAVIYSGAYLCEVMHTRVEEEQLFLGLQRFEVAVDLPARAVAQSRTVKGGLHSPPRPLKGILSLIVYGGIALLSAAVVLGGNGEQVVNRVLGRSNGSGPGPALMTLPTDFAGAMDWRAVQSLKGMNSLASESIRDALGLTASQRRSLDLIFADTSQRLHELYSHPNAASSPAVARQSVVLVDEAVQRVLCTLTDQQIGLWRMEMLRALNADAALRRAGRSG